MNTLPDLAGKALPPHTGILRDETVLLRQLFGFADGEISTVVRDLGCLESCETLCNTSIKDVILVGIDVDTFQGYEEIIPDQQFHVGVSIIDTRSIWDLVLASPATEVAINAIQSYQFTVGASKYCYRASRKFLFGESESVLLSELKHRVKSVIPRRDLITVFHGAYCDTKFLRQLQIDLQPLYVIDTVKAAQSPLQLHFRLGLEKLLEALDIPYANLHAAGNDAHFVLRALLMLVVKDAERQGLPSQEGLLQALRAVAQAPHPPTRAKIEAPLIEARKQAKRETQARRKARRAERTERRKLERERRLAALDDPDPSLRRGIDSGISVPESPLCLDDDNGLVSLLKPETGYIRCG